MLLSSRFRYFPCFLVVKSVIDYVEVLSVAFSWLSLTIQLSG